MSKSAATVINSDERAIARANAKYTVLDILPMNDGSGRYILLQKVPGSVDLNDVRQLFERVVPGEEVRKRALELLDAPWPEHSTTDTHAGDSLMNGVIDEDEGRREMLREHYRDDTDVSDEDIEDMMHVRHRPPRQATQEDIDNFMGEGGTDLGRNPSQLTPGYNVPGEQWEPDSQPSKPLSDDDFLRSTGRTPALPLTDRVFGSPEPSQPYPDPVPPPFGEYDTRYM